ncbi:MAG: lipoate--protein ligase family protein [Chitinispirillales bacterium]|jgi:lipoate-protein ligase A|nr:lipoate--protein ligase family protein [Chitinispirillales bacterium]
MMRFIIDKDRSAEFNMAADRYLLKRRADGDTDGATDVTIRLYSWAIPTVSIGYMQSPDSELDLNALSAAGAGWIRRITGGRAVLHDCDITYSVTFPKTARDMGGGIRQTYNIIARCLMEGLGKASIKCEAHDSDGGLTGIGRQAKLPCFLAPNRDEIMVGGRKLVGSAQKRTADGVLQHGSIPINANYRNLPMYLRIDEAEREKQRELLTLKSCCIAELTAGGMTFESLAECLMKGFASVLPFKWEVIPWSLEEESQIL